MTADFAVISLNPLLILQRKESDSGKLQARIKIRKSLLVNTTISYSLSRIPALCTINQFLKGGNNCSRAFRFHRPLPYAPNSLQSTGSRGPYLPGYCVIDHHCEGIQLSDRLPPLLREICSRQPSLPSFEELCASPELRTTAMETHYGIYLPEQKAGRKEAQPEDDDLLRILEERYDEQHFLARTSDTLRGHFIYEWKNRRLTTPSLLEDIMQTSRRLTAYPVYHLSFTDELARQVAPYITPEAESLSFCGTSHACFEGPRKVAVIYRNSVVLGTPVWDRESPRKDDLWGIEKSLLGNAVIYGLSTGAVCGVLGGFAGLVLQEFTHIPAATYATYAAAAGGIIGAASNLLVYAGEIFIELGSALKNAFIKKFSRKFQDSPENRANEILLPIYTDTDGVWEKTEKLGAVISELRQGES